MRGLSILVVLAVLQLGCCSVQFPPLTPFGPLDSPPVTDWLLTPETKAPNGIHSDERVAWQKVGSKLWTFLSNLDHDFVDGEGQSVPPSLAQERAFGPDVSCGRMARMWMRIAFHDCGTFDIGNTGSEGDTGRPRFGCNGSIRREVGPCLGGPGCTAEGQERRLNLETGEFLEEGAFDSLVATYGADKVDWAQDTVAPRFENIGFSNNLAFFYQVQLEAQNEADAAYRLPGLSYADVVSYAGMLAVAKCEGPHIEFQPGRVDTAVADAPSRLPAPTSPLSVSASFFWTMGVTTFDMVNLLAAHSTSCFTVGCLDSTPRKFDTEWAKLVLSVNSGDDERICRFDVTGFPANPVPVCVLPSDAELAARADTRGFMFASTTNDSKDIMRAVYPASTASPYNSLMACPKPKGSNCTARPAKFAPFKVLRSVNLCNRNDVVPAPSCAYGNDFTNLHALVSTSFFKMSKMYPTNSDGTPVDHAKWDIRPQPCQPGLVKIGPPLLPENGFVPTEPNPVCTCCTETPPQSFDVTTPPTVVAQPVAGGPPTLAPGRPGRPQAPGLPTIPKVAPWLME